MAENNPDIEAKKTGRAGKLYCIEVVYTYFRETKKLTIQNRTWSEVIEFRARVFDLGIMVPVVKGHWKLVSPYDITDIDIYQQSGYFDPNKTDILK